MSRKNNLPYKVFSKAFETPKVSVILPAYNMEKYIVFAIRSIQSQSLNEIEIVVVDDRSRDSTVSVVKQLMMNDKRIVLYENSINRGTLFTRSLGTMKAKGKYLLFLDPDDFFCNLKIIEKTYERAEKDSLDIVEFNWLGGNGFESKPVFEDRTFHEDIILQPDISKRLYEKNGKITYNQGNICGKLIKRTVLLKTLSYLKSKGILEKHICNMEDQLVNFFIYTFASSLSCVNEYGYYYYSREGSATHIGKNVEGRKKNLKDHMQVLNFLYNNRFDKIEKRERKFLEFLFSTSVRKLAKYKDLGDYRYNKYIERIEKCLDCSEIFKNSVYKSFKLL